VSARDRDKAERDDRDELDPTPTLDPIDAPTVGLDPLERALYQPRAPLMGEASRMAPSPPPPMPAPPLDTLLDRFVKRFAMSGDRNRGTAHLSVGAGELAGGTVTLHAENGAVTIVVDAPAGADGAGLGERLRARMAGRGIEATVEVRLGQTGDRQQATGNGEWGRRDGGGAVAVI
jgi:hypothetical protein